VRRLVEYEDHLLRPFRDVGLPTPAPYGFVEITPEREYLIAMEFFADAEELGRRPLTEQEIDDGLAIVRRMWDSGVAHRDIKPSNLLVRDGRVKLIDVAFGAVRPTPWRQAVDLANMMLSLALASSPEQVYPRALEIFTAEDVAEAFAASRGVTIPAQLKSRLRSDGRDLTGQFRRLAPRRSPVAIQRWTLRRVAATLGVAATAAVIGWGSVVYARTAGLL
jgi:tRNA A-37 threonylcarbamoyl transferase component Bud32